MENQAERNGSCALRGKEKGSRHNDFNDRNRGEPCQAARPKHIPWRTEFTSGSERLLPPDRTP